VRAARPRVADRPAGGTGHIVSVPLIMEFTLEHAVRGAGLGAKARSGGEGKSNNFLIHTDLQ
jgi:hypothetical protein